MAIRKPPQVVIVGARGETRQSDERLDLTRAFLIAGAASVLATRWKVPYDPATTRFLLDFYRACRQGGPGGKGLRKDQALTEARRRSRGATRPGLGSAGVGGGCKVRKPEPQVAAPAPPPKQSAEDGFL